MFRLSGLLIVLHIQCEPGWCLLLVVLLPSIPQGFLLRLVCGLLAKPDWTETPGSAGWTTSSLCGSSRTACRRVCVCVSFCCCCVCVNCHLLCCTCLCLLRKLLQYLWLLCNSECVCVCVRMWGSGKSSSHMAELLPVLLKFILFFLRCSLQPNPRFYHKAGRLNLHR